MHLQRAGLQGQGSSLELDGSPKGMNEGDFTEGFGFMNHFQVAENSRLILPSKVITSLFVVRWQYLLKLPQLQNRLGFRSLLLFACLYQNHHLGHGFSLSVVRKQESNLSPYL